MFKHFLLAAAALGFSTLIHAEQDGTAPTEQTETVQDPTSIQAAANNKNTAYIIDELHIFMHSGAGKKYRILGSVNAGTELELVSEDDDSGYFKVKDQKGRTGWVDKRYISKKPGLLQQLQQSKEELFNTQNTLKEAQVTLPQLEQKNNELTLNNQTLTKQVKSLQLKIDEQINKVSQASEAERKQLLLYGGGIAFVGLFLGVLLTLMLSRRKRHEGWA